VRRMLTDPQSFLDGQRGRRVLLDETHRLSNPSQVLKIAARRRIGQFVLLTLLPRFQENELSRNSARSSARSLSLT
jgi:hypothetical protein